MNICASPWVYIGYTELNYTLFVTLQPTEEDEMVNRKLKQYVK